MKKILITRFLLIISLLGIIFVGTNKISYAASYDKEFVEQIENEYDEFYKKEKQEYDNYKATYDAQYDSLYPFVEDERRIIEGVFKQDFNKLLTILNNDYKQLENRFGNNKKYYYKLDDYEDAIDPDELNSAMDRYEDTIDPDELNSAMDRYEDTIDPDELNSAMDNYEDTIDPNELNSVMDIYEDTVDPNTLNSAMDRYEDTVDSILREYKRGDISKEEVKRKLLVIEDYKEKIKIQKEESINKINEVRRKTYITVFKSKYDNMKDILEQREKSIKIFNKVRKTGFGQGINLPTLNIDIPINIVLNGELQKFTQPPVLIDRVTMVPLRGIFEKLGAEVVWDAQKKSIKALKNNIKINLKINDSVAVISGVNTSLLASPKVINGSTMVPLRFISESLGADVEWIGESKLIFIDSVE